MEIWNDSANLIALQWLNAGFYEGDIFGSLGEKTDGDLIWSWSNMGIQAAIQSL